MSGKACNRTLVDKEIIKWAKSKDWMEEGGIYDNFEEKCVHGETYDIRAGDLIILGEPDGRRRYISLSEQKEITIDPFRAATVQSFEKLKLPLDMYGELWTRNELQHRGLAFTGGDIDPGFWGYLYIKIHNVGPVPVSIGYQERIASTRFVKMCEAAREPYTETEIIKPREQQLPPTPPRIVYDWLQLSTKLDNLGLALDHLKWIQDRFVVGLFAGLIGGLTVAAIVAIFRVVGILP